MRCGRVNRRRWGTGRRLAWEEPRQGDEIAKIADCIRKRHPVRVNVVLVLGRPDLRMTDERARRPRYTIPIGAHPSLFLTPTRNCISNRRVYRRDVIRRGSACVEESGTTTHLEDGDTP